MTRKQIAVVGSGIVGVSCALYLQRDGHQVTIVDPKLPGTATSYGNAGGIVTGAVMPNSTPALWANMPRMLFHPDSAVRARWSYMPRLTPWMISFLAAGRDSRVRDIARAMRPLVSAAYDAHRELIALSGADGIVRPVGWLKVYATEAGFAHTAYDRAIMQENGVRFDELSADEVRQLEPSLAGGFVKGLFQPESGFASLPVALTQAHAAHFVAQGGKFVQERVRGLKPEPTSVVLDCELGLRRFDYAVIAAGAWSRHLVQQVGDKVLLDTERGYHLNLDPGEAGELRRPVVFSDRGGFVLAPMQDGIRLTSGVELAGLDAPPDFSRIHRLVPVARQVLPGLSSRVTRQWMGYRPSTPDSLPVIGPSPRAARVVYAFGHQHLGLTLGPITGRLVADVIGGRTPGIALAPYGIARFA